ncbi:MAG TPA: transketolase [Solirubrobacteraceae bacterium]|jgi:transketolase|nr:transketolase [Solirubrobacteraceae bacterium]
MTSETDQLCVDTIRALSMDAIQKANSGHPGLPMAMAPAAYVLFRRIMSHDPAEPAWPNRDRFVLSAGHGSMLLYSVLHLTGYELPMEQIEQFRQWGSITPGHPERDRHVVTPGVEVTTGPLGQGFANGVGMAFAEQYLREHFGSEVVDHHTFAIVSDGDLMEGISSEAASLAGQVGLGRLVYLYDDNDISLDGPTSLSFDRENVSARFEAYGWQVLQIGDANDLDAIETAVREGMANEDQPTLIRIKSVIGYPSPNKQGKSAAHGAALGEEEVALTKKAMGWDPEKFFYVPDGVYDAFSMKDVGGKAHAAWHEAFSAWRDADADRAAEWDLAWGTPGRPLPGMADALPKTFSKPKIATRAAGGQVMAAFEPFTPTMIGGAADLTESTKTIFPKSERFTSEKAGRNVFFGVREHAMGAAVNGMAAHGGIVCPYGSTFLQFADYMRSSIRLSALMGLHVAWVYTHDSVALGEDGPTHQPVEHIAALRAIPGLVVLRPGDAHETVEAWRVILEDLEGPAVLVLSRQDLPVLDRESGEYASAAGVARGAYVLADAEDAVATIIATGSEVEVALDARALLDVPVRVVSMPSWELFEEQDEEYQESVLPVELPVVSVEAAISMGWERYADSSVSVERFGASAPAGRILEEFGITPANVAEHVRELLDDEDDD